MTSKKKKLVANIIFYTLIVLIYGFVAFQLVVKFNGGNVYIFGTRYDVVLTDSMSVKNSHHLDFLEGTCQFQPYDIVRSKRIDENTELKLKDVVLYKSPELQGNTVAHRIAEIVQTYDTLDVFQANEATFNGNKTLVLNEYSSYVKLSNESLKSIEIEYLSNEQKDIQFSFRFGSNYIDGEVTSTKVDNYYKNVAISYNESKAEMPSYINLTALGDSYITRITYTTHADRKFSFTAEEYVSTSEDTFETEVNIIDFYKFRGDKYYDFDNGGYAFARSELLAKVENVIPKLGYVVGFFSSIYGIILLIGLAIIITVATFLYNRVGSKNTSNGGDAPVTETATEETPTEETKEETEGKEETP